MNSEFWNMGGYAFYIWTSYAAALVVFVWNWLAPRAQHREILRMLRENKSAE